MEANKGLKRMGYIHVIGNIKRMYGAVVALILMGGVMINIMPVPAHAQSASATIDAAQVQVQELKDKLADYRSQVCNASKEEDSYDTEVLQVAYTLSDTYEKAVSATSDSPWATLANNSLGEAYQCAQSYINHVASVKKRQAGPGKSVAEKIIAASGDCWPCNIAFLMIDSIQVMASAIYDSVAGFALVLLGVMLMFWLAFRVLLLIGKFGYSSNSEFFTDLLYRFIAVTIAAVLLSTPILEFYRIAISPLISITASLAVKFTEYSMADDSGRTFASQVMEKLKEQKEREGSCDTNLLQKMADKATLSGYDEKTKRDCCILSLNGEWIPTRTVQSCSLGLCQNVVLPEECKFNRLVLSGAAATKEGFTCSYCADAMDPDAVLPHTSAFTTVLDDQTINALLCLICTLYKQFAPLIESGSAIFQYVITNWEGFFIFRLPMPFMGLFLGPALMILFGMLAFVIAFRVIDIFLRLGFVIILTPLLITAWAFPISRQYAKKGWDFIVGTLLEFLGIAVAGALLMNLCLVLLPDSAMENLIPAMAGTDVETLYDAFTGDIPGGSLYTIMVLVCVFFIGLKLLETTQKLVEAISGISLGIPPLSSAAAKQMLNTAGKGASVAGKHTGATDALKNVGKAAPEGSAAALGAFMGGASMKQAFGAGHAVGMSRLNQAGKSLTNSTMVSHAKGAGKGVTNIASKTTSAVKQLSTKEGLKAFADNLKNLPKDLKDGTKFAVKHYIRGRKAAFGRALESVAGVTRGMNQSRKDIRKHLSNISNLVKNPQIAAQVAGKYALDKKGNALDKVAGTSSTSPIETLKNAAVGAGVVARVVRRHPMKTMKNIAKKAYNATAGVREKMKHPLDTWKQTVQKIDAVAAVLGNAKARDALNQRLNRMGNAAKRMSVAAKMRPDPKKPDKYA